MSLDIATGKKNGKQNTPHCGKQINIQYEINCISVTDIHSLTLLVHTCQEQVDWETVIAHPLYFRVQWRKNMKNILFFSQGVAFCLRGIT